MIFGMLTSIFLNGFSLLVGILGVMRLLYSFRICEPPHLAGDPVENYRVSEARRPPPTGAPPLVPIKWRLSLARPIPDQTIPISDQTVDHTDAVIDGVLSR